MAMAVARRVSRGIAGTEKKQEVSVERQTTPLGLSKFAPIAPVAQLITLKGSNIAQGSLGRIPSTTLAGDRWRMTASMQTESAPQAVNAVVDVQIGDLDRSR